MGINRLLGGFLSTISAGTLPITQSIQEHHSCFDNQALVVPLSFGLNLLSRLPLEQVVYILVNLQIR